jgi:hypothetical protein
MAGPQANIALSGRLNGDFHLPAPPRDDGPIDMAGGLSVSNGLKAVDVAPPAPVEGTSVQETSVPNPVQVESSNMKTVFLAPGLKNELIPARGVPNKTKRYESGEEHGNDLLIHLLAGFTVQVVGFRHCGNGVRPPRRPAGPPITGAGTAGAKQPAWSVEADLAQDADLVIGLVTE